ncbi:MAG: PorT family protein, partial [Sphingobacteriales bacterium]
ASNGDKSIGRVNYIRVPLQGIYFFGDYGQAVRPKISLGPSFGFLVGGETKTDINGQTITFKTKEVAKSFDFGLTGAIGANFRIAEATWLNADIAYYHGLIDASKTIAEIKNRNIGINIDKVYIELTSTPTDEFYAIIGFQNCNA